ncbi:hypothetical protein CPAST_c34640 [Clostridium pasteurianum DSM 525 = ATCC 6013]|uniref:Uncharacterized protein n=1 Tax=Clostridium pasteurianum DSM 525 = ATCC 6013 TaxID=1262449 RepID=A0A0H3JBD2_CLOPA|nr:hypothetical protein [Clostridium pasteurianum]AJA49525.1 hypothetical protein CPAST_c34640 [Clostridium pasteurianum DSM 525 = ATCC 6013]AJA53513.1 hypothetical protein CLPA_c34640 [Clostridium pasteurianum DSM 525 = ATCC 6013]AOZ76685.1 hypothetical protein AQ983_16825 [Clostridium pasteurianum DSM 525 = ATCC 6013]AOZ80482.1 hypothetical protein AQ984_16820 [Clostridium pasteurianum]ELP58957.1 hypothetical protein F502_12551 [Clostridium pasteurianum DSM 525 = ATCC 6013]
MSYADQIRVEPNAKDMRELIADGIEENKSVADDAVNTANEAKSTADNNNNRIDNILSGQIEGKDQEIVDSHHSNITQENFNNLGERFDGIDSTLADNTIKIGNTDIIDWIKENPNVADGLINLRDWMNERGINVRQPPYLAPADGNSHLLSERFNTLEEAQLIFPCATDLSDELDWCALQAATDYVRINGGQLIVPYTFGGYVINKTWTAQYPDSQSPVTIIGNCGKGSLFNQKNIVKIKRKTGTNATMFYALGQGLTLANITFQGNEQIANAVIIDRGFELKMDNVRVIDNKGCAYDFSNLSNARIGTCHADRCGYDGGTDATHFPAVRLGGKIVEQSAEHISNTVLFDFLTIERSRGTALAVAVGAGDEAVAEFITFNMLHVEQTIDNTDMVDFSPRQVVHIGNVRSVDLISPFIYGGKGELLRVEKWHNVSGDITSVKIFGGEIKGYTKNGAVTSGTPGILVRLKSGDCARLIGTTLAHVNTGGAHLYIGSEMGKDVQYNTIHLNDSIGNPTNIWDERTNKSGLRTINTTWVENSWALINGLAEFTLITEGRPKITSNSGKPVDLTEVRGVSLPVVSDALSPVEPNTLYISADTGKLVFKDSNEINHYLY